MLCHYGAAELIRRCALKMKQNQTVCLAGGHLDRADHLRQLSVSELKAQYYCAVIVHWRGKLLCSQNAKLIFVPMAHDGVDQNALIFLGLMPQESSESPQRAIFGYDLAHWGGAGQDLTTLGGFSDQSVQTHPSFEGGFYELRAIMPQMQQDEASLAAALCGMARWHQAYQYCPRCAGPLEAQKMGWTKVCTSCQRPQFPRTDPVVIALVTDQDRVLLGRGLGFPDGLYSILAGFVEPGESLEQAAAREVLEEAGVRIGPVRILVSQPWPFPASLMVAVAAEATDAQITIDETEMADVRWVSKQELLRAYAGTHDSLLPPRNGAIAHYVLQKWLEDSW